MKVLFHHKRTYILRRSVPNYFRTEFTFSAKKQNTLLDRELRTLVNTDFIHQLLFLPPLHSLKLLFSFLVRT